MKTLVVIILVMISGIEMNAQTLPWRGEYKIIDSCDFTNVCDLILIDANAVGSKWVFAQNTKPGFDTVTNLGNGLITDSTQSYIPNTRTIAELLIKPTNYTFNDGNAILGFKHQYHTTKNKDGGFIEISYDSGVTWENVILDHRNQVNHFYLQRQLPDSFYNYKDSLFNGSIGFSGNSKGWIQTYFYMVRRIPLKTFNHTRIRFVFISDSIEDSLPGWLIDNIKLYDYYLYGGLKHNQPLVSTLYPNPATKSFTLAFTKTIYDLKLLLYSVDGRLVQTTTTNAANELVVQRNNLQQGIYYYQLFSGKDVIVNGKVIFE